MSALQGASLSPASGSISQMDCTVLCLLFLSVWCCLRLLVFCADKFYYMPVLCVCGRVIMLWFVLEALMLKQHMKEKLFNKKKIWNTALVHLPQSPGKVLLSKFTVVHIVLLCDQSICVTKHYEKMLAVHGIEGFTSLRTDIFYHLCIKTAFIPPVEWDETQTSNLPISWYNENLACKTPLKPMRRKCHVCMIFKHF